MNRLGSYILLVAILMIAFVEPVAGQWEARFGLPPVNPNSGLEMNPRVIYDPFSGIVSLDNAGDNGIVESDDGSGNFNTLLGDDVGMISFVMTMQSDAEIEVLLPVFGNGIAWGAPNYFDGRIQLSGNSITSQFLPVRENPTEIFALPSGLTAADFAGPSGSIEIEIGINHAPAVPGMTLFSVGDPIASGAFQILEEPGVNGDFDDDFDWDCADVDSLVAEIVGGTNNVGFDLTGDGMVDHADLDFWLAEAGQRNLASGNPYLPGDANLDGFVDVSDVNTWNVAKFSSAQGWCLGDFNADGGVDVTDFNIWNEHKFQSSDTVTAVPEPGMATLLITGLLLLFPLRRRQMLVFPNREA